MVCTICRQTIEDDQELYACPDCDSEFHSREIVEWFQENDECPNCRANTDPYEIFLLTDHSDLESDEIEEEPVELRDTAIWQERQRIKRQERKTALAILVAVAVVTLIIILITELFFY